MNDVGIALSGGGGGMRTPRHFVRFGKRKGPRPVHRGTSAGAVVAALCATVTDRNT